MALLTLPLILLNLFGGVISGIWLGILGEWRALGFGIAAAVFSTFALSLVMMPGLLFAAPAAVLVERGRTFLALPFLILSQIYTYAVISAWCLLVLYFFVSRAGNDSFWPLLIWSYGVALGPWIYMARKEMLGGAGDASAMTTFFAQIAYVAAAVVVVFGRPTLAELGLVFGGVMVIGMLVQTVTALVLLRTSKPTRSTSPEYL